VNDLEGEDPEGEYSAMSVRDTCVDLEGNAFQDTKIALETRPLTTMVGRLEFQGDHDAPRMDH